MVGGGAVLLDDERTRALARLSGAASSRETLRTLRGRRIREVRYSCLRLSGFRNAIVYAASTEMFTEGTATGSATFPACAGG